MYIQNNITPATSRNARDIPSLTNSC